MFIVDKRVSHVLEGYDRICSTNRRLKSEWRTRLLAAYARRRAAYDAAVAAQRAERRRRAPRAVPVILGGVALLASGLIAAGSMPWLALLLMLFGSALVVPFGLWLWQAGVPAVRPPHPLHEPWKSRLFPALLPAWRQGLRGTLPKEQAYHGAPGEYALVRALEALRGRDGYILYRLQQNWGDDIDVAIVGPYGLWVFEVKYWSGTVSWQGQWAREQTHYAAGGRLVTEHPPVDQAPDEQWRRMADDVAKTLRRHAPRLVARHPALLKVQGGIAFTHPEATYKIAPGMPCAWGDVAAWRRKAARARPLDSLTERDLLAVLDTLLARHRAVSDENVHFSMDTYAADLADKQEKALAAWVRGRPRAG
jgi:hypothetical protein